jgi:hypothetical protein
VIAPCRRRRPRAPARHLRSSPGGHDAALVRRCSSAFIFHRSAPSPRQRYLVHEPTRGQLLAAAACAIPVQK